MLRTKEKSFEKAKVMSTTKLPIIVAAFVLVFISLASSLLHPQEKPGVNEKSFLWKVQSKKNTVYILGSIHFLKKDSYPLGKTIEKAFNDTKKLVLEIDPASLNQESSQRAMLMKGLYDNSRTLKENISEGTYTLAEKQAKKLGMDIRTLNKFEPWFIALTITTLKLRKLSLSPNYGIDKYFSDKARKAEKEILSLETFEYQINLFDKMGQGTQELLLLQTLKDVDVMEKEFNRIVDSWATGDMKRLEKILLGSFGEYPEVYQKLISDRNRRWLPKIERFLAQSENYMVIVGAGHLVGKEGLIELLKEKGYSLEQL